MQRIRLITQATIIVLATAIGLGTAAATPAFGQTAAPEPSTPTTSSPLPSYTDIPFTGLSADISEVQGQLDAATARVFQLETEITALDEDRRALEERLAVTAGRLIEQASAVDEADATLASAEEAFRSRVVAVYKRGSYDILGLLLSSDTLTELVSRMALLTRIVEDDGRVVADLNLAAADARYQQSLLADLQAQDRTLEQELETRISTLSTLLDEQESLVIQLTVEAREALLAARQFTASTRQQWRNASIPIGTDIPRDVAAVDSRPGLTYVISSYMPRSYRSTGETFAAVCSWYGPGFNGRGTASGQVFNEDDFTCASRTLPFGTVLALTRGDRRIIVYVNDRGPYIDGRDLDLSKAAATALGFSGVATVQVEVVLPIQ